MLWGLTHKLFQLLAHFPRNMGLPWQEFDCIVWTYLERKQTESHGSNGDTVHMASYSCSNFTHPKEPARAQYPSECPCKHSPQDVCCHVGACSPYTLESGLEGNAVKLISSSSASALISRCTTEQQRPVQHWWWCLQADVYLPRPQTHTHTFKTVRRTILETGNWPLPEAQL